jgi:hypothetical protein
VRPVERLAFGGADGGAWVTDRERGDRVAGSRPDTDEAVKRCPADGRVGLGSVVVPRAGSNRGGRFSSNPRPITGSDDPASLLADSARTPSADSVPGCSAANAIGAAVRGGEVMAGTEGLKVVEGCSMRCWRGRASGSWGCRCLLTTGHSDRVWRGP